MRNYLLIIGIIASTFLILSSNSVYASDNCTIIYGGGEIKCQATQSANTAPTQPVTTKGGLPVYSPTHATGTPGTGPEALGLISLVPAAAAGIFLRRKTK